MDIWTLDFETYFSDEYTLKKQTTEEYIRDQRFESLLLGVRDPRGSLAWYGRDDICEFLASVDWGRAACLCHHSHFDGFILSHHYGVKPGAWLDTLSMARLVLGNHVRVGLDSLASHYGLEGKSVPYEAFKGKRWDDIDHSLRRQLGHGCLHDIELTWDIFQRLAAGFPIDEYQVIDMTIRMFTESPLVGDMQEFGDVWVQEARRKKEMLALLGVTSTELQSAERFAELLRAEDIEPEKKQGKNGLIYSFAKTDQFMRDLLEHDDERVRALAEARLGVKSTLDQTRAERLGFMASRGMKRA